jgi:hypothetical protein
MDRDDDDDTLEPLTLGRYKLAERIGRGGMGEVLSARDDQIGRSVAVKRMRGNAPTPQSVARFLREARIQGRLEHPAVVPVHELSRDDDGQPFFVMKQLAGVTLLEVIGRLGIGDAETRKQFPRQRLLRAFVDVCLAIEFAHTRGIVHRDLKPANIVLGEFGEVYVLDWGVAHVADDERPSFSDIDTLDDSTLSGAMLGTPGYMAPEQIRADPALDGRADVYALGSILFEILALQPLHARGLAALASTAAGVEARVSVRAPDKDVPPELDALCVAATAVERDDRIATARQLGDAVQRFLDGDRDVALRRELARAEIATARAALERGNGAAERKLAIRAAARALALDPAGREPAELVGRLMLEPPAEVPAEIEDELDAMDFEAVYAARKLVSYAALAYVVFLPFIYWTGMRDVWLFLAIGGLATTAAIVGLSTSRARLIPAAYFATTAHCAIVAIVSWAYTPFLAAPGLAVITTMSIAPHPRIAYAPALVVVMAVAVLGPLALAVIGTVRDTTAFVGDSLILHTAAPTLDPTGMVVGLSLFVVVLLVLAALLSRSLTNERRAVQRTLQIQSWHLRQLVIGE